MEEKFIKFMRDGRWHTISEITHKLDLTRDDLRVMSVFTDGRLIGSTRLGFKLTECATTDEVKHALASLRSRASAIQERAAAISRQHYA